MSRRRNPYARVLALPLFKQRVVVDKKKQQNKYNSRKKGNHNDR